MHIPAAEWLRTDVTWRWAGLWRDYLHYTHIYKYLLLADWCHLISHLLELNKVKK